MAFVEDAPATRWHLAFMSDQALERQHGDRALDYRASMAILFMVIDSGCAYFPLGTVAFLHSRSKMKITGESIPESGHAPE